MGYDPVHLLLSSYFYSRRSFCSPAVRCRTHPVNLLLNYRSPVLDLLVMIALVFPVIPERISRLTILPRAGSTMRVVVLAALAMGAGALSNTAIHVVTKAVFSAKTQRPKTKSSRGPETFCWAEGQNLWLACGPPWTAPNRAWLLGNGLQIPRDAGRHARRNRSEF